MNISVEKSDYDIWLNRLMPGVFICMIAGVLLSVEFEKNGLALAFLIGLFLTVGGIWYVSRKHDLVERERFDREIQVAKKEPEIDLENTNWYFKPAFEIARVCFKKNGVGIVTRTKENNSKTIGVENISWSVEGKFVALKDAKGNNIGFIDKKVEGVIASLNDGGKVLTLQSPKGDAYLTRV